MKLKRRRAHEVPSKIKTFINNVTATPPENIEDSLKSFFWVFDKGDFHHWVDLFNHFDTYFEKYIKPRKDLQLGDNSLESDPPFPREAVLHILRVIRIILENCTNKHFYSSYEHHLSSLLSSTDSDVVEASLQTLAAFLKKSNAKYNLIDASLRSRLFAFAQGWGGKEDGLGLISCALQNGLDPIAFELGCSLHFQFYAVSETANESTSSEQMTRGLQVIHISAVDSMKESDLELLNKLAVQYKVPHDLRFSLLTRLRFARAFSSAVTRHHYTCIRLYAFIVLVQACSDTDDLVSYLNTEPEFINELVTLLSYEDAIPGKIRILCILSLVALCQDRSRQPTVLSVVTLGGHRGILSSLMLKAVDSVVNNPSKCSIVFAECLLSLITMLVSSSSGCSAMREAGFIPTLLPLLKDVNPQHLHLVSTAVHVLEAFMDYSNPAAALFRDLGGLDDTITRLMVEVSYIENGSKQHNISVDLDCAGRGGSQIMTDTFAELDSSLPLFSEALVSYHRRLLMKALLRAISLGTYAPGTTTHVYGSEESLLPHCICIIFKRAKDFGGGVFSLAATLMSDLIHKDPTCISVLDGAGIPSAFIDAIMDGVLCSAEAITCIPQCLDALCLNNNGLQAVKERNALRCFVKVFTSKTYLRALAADTLGSLSSGLDELMRHASSLRGEGVDMLIEILNNIAKIGSGLEAASQSTHSLSCSEPVPMEIESENRYLPFVDVRDSHKPESGSSELILDASSMNVESFLPDCISNASHFLESVLQNSDTCRIFVEKKGIECVLQLFTLPLIPLSACLGQSITVAFKNFSPQHSTSLARALCLFLRDHLKLTNELLTSIGGSQFAQIEFSERVKILRCLSSLEGILYLCNSLLKGTTTIISELGSAAADVFKDLGKVYREILWQISLCCELKVEEKRNVEPDPASADRGLSTVVGRESDDDANIPSIRYINPAAVRNAPHSHWGVEREFIPTVRSGEGSSRRSRHSLARLRGSRIGRCLEAFQMDYEAGPSNAEISYCVMKQKNPEILILENLNKLASTMRSFFTALVKGFTFPNRRRTETASLVSAANSVGTALAKNFLEALGFSGYSNSNGHDISLSVKCRYLGKVVADMAALTFDSRRRTCYNAMINNFYVHGTFKELLTTFEATSQLLWTLPYVVSDSGADIVKIGEGGKPSQSSWLLDTLRSHCRELEYFVNSGLLLSSTSASQILVQPVDVGLSLGLFPVPKDPEAFICMLQSQVLDVIRPIWCHPLFPKCGPCFITSIISLMIHVCNGVSDVKRSRGGFSGTVSQRFMPPPDEAIIVTIIEMGFSRARAEEALRRAETNSVEMAMEWLFNHAEDPVQEDDELARALALSLGSSSETPKIDSADKSVHVLLEEGQAKAPPADDILATAMKLFQGSDTLAFRLTDFLVTVCNRNTGEDRMKVISYLVQQLKLYPLEFSKDSSPLGMISHTLALIISEDGSARDIAAQNGIVSIVIDILMNFMGKKEASNGLLVHKCISALLLILDNLSQTRPKLCGDGTDGAQNGPPSDSTENQSSETKNKSIPIVKDKNDCTLDGSEFEDMLGKPTGYLTMEESSKALVIACDLIKRHVPPMVMQAVLQLCARLTKSHVLALQFLESGGMIALFGIPRGSFFPGYVTLASAIIRHLLEDPQTLQTAIELEIRQTLGGNRHVGGISVRTFLTSMAPVISRNPEVFMRAALSVCQLESLGGSSIIMLSKDKEKEKPKASGVEAGASTNECRIVENKSHDGFSKYSKGHKKVSANLTQVIDFLLEIVLAYPMKEEDGCAGHLNTMEVDEPTTKKKGKLKVDETLNLGSDGLADQLASLAKMTFVLKLLSDILLMYVHAGGVILKRDLEMSQLRMSGHIGYPGQGGVIHHILHCLLPISVDKSFGSDEWRDKLSEKASWFLVVLAGRSSEGRRRVFNELFKSLSSFSQVENNPFCSNLLPDKKILAFVDLVYSILSKNSSAGNLPGSGCSPDIAKSMIDGGIVHCLSDILQAIDLDHPDALKVVNLILKSLESLTRAANANEQVLKSDVLNKKKIIGQSGRSDAQHDGIPASQELQTTEDGNEQHRAISNTGLEAYPQIMPHNDGNQTTNLNVSMEQEMRTEEIPNASPPMELELDYMHEEMEESRASPNSTQMTFRVENRVDHDMNDEEDVMGDDGDDDDDDDGEEDDEDEDIAEDGTGLMSLADTDVEDRDDTGIRDEYIDDMIDEEDDFHENRVIEVRWREALDGLDHLQVRGQTGTGGGLIDVAETFEGVTVDDLFGMRRSFGFERRRQANRTSYERSVTEGNGFQHPLLLRPSHSGDSVSVWASSGNTSQDSGGTENLDVAHFYMFDASILPHENSPSNIFGDRLGGSAPPPLADFSTGLESLHVSGRRGPSDGRWTDDGQPQAGGQATAIAQAVEEKFISLLSNNVTADNDDKFSQNLAVPDKQGGDSIIVSRLSNNVTADNGDKFSQNLAVPDKQGGDSIIADNQLEDIVDALQNDDRSHEPQLLEMGITEVLAEQAGGCQQARENVPSLIVSDIIEMGGGNVFGSESLETSSCLIAQNGVLFDMTSRDGIPSQDEGSDMSFVQDNQSSSHAPSISGSCLQVLGNHHASSSPENSDVEMGIQKLPRSEINLEEPSLQQSGLIVRDSGQADESRLNNEASNSNGIDPTFLDALPEDLRAEVLASQQAQPAQAPTPTYAPPTVEDIDPEFLAALPLDIQAEVLAQQRVQRIAQQSDGQPVDMDNASIIATFSADLREEVLLTSSEAVLSALPSPLLAEAQMLRDRALNRYHARSLFGNSQGLNSRGNRLGLGFDWRTVMDRGVGVTIGGGSSPVDNLKLKELDGEPLLNSKGLKALIRLLRLGQPLGKGLLQRLLLNLCTHSETRAILVRLLLDMINPESVGIAGGVTAKNAHRLYGCQSHINGQSQLRDGVPSIVMRRVLEILTYMSTNHSGIASLLFYFDASNISESSITSQSGGKSDKGKEKFTGEEHHLSLSESSQNGDVPLILLLRLLSQPLCLRSISHLEQVMGLLQVVVFAAAAKVECKSSVAETACQTENVSGDETAIDIQKDPHVNEVKPNPLDQSSSALNSKANCQKSDTTHDIFVRIPRQDLHNLCSLLGHEGLSDKVYSMAGEVLKKLAFVAVAHRKFFVSELSESAHRLSRSAVNELITLRDTHMLGLSSGSMAGASVLRVLQILSAVTSVGSYLNEDRVDAEVQEEHTTMSKLNVALESLWEELSECISAVESELSQNSRSPVSSINIGEQMQVSPASPPLPPGSQRLLPFIEGFFVLCEKIQSNNTILHQDNFNVTAREVKESTGSSVPSSAKCVDPCRRLDGSVTFARFAEKHRRLLNAFIRQNPALLEKSLCMMLKASRLIDFDNKRAYFRSRIRQQHDQHLSGPLRISVRRPYILEDSYNQLRKRPSQDLKGRLNVHFQGEEGIDAGGLTREWYQLLSRVLFDKGALLFTTVGNNATFQPNPNSVYQTEHLSYFRFVGRVVAKALFDGQLLDVYFTRSFYKHILGVKVTYHDIEAVDPDYYKNLKWMLENDVSDIPDLTFSIDADEEKQILYEKTEVTDYELKPGGRNIRLTEETKHEYVDLVADHILTNAIRPQITSFLGGFNELVPRELISIFNDKELELLISGLPEIDLDDLKANTEYTGYTAASNVVQWFWEVVKGFNKEDMARLLQFVTGTSKVPLEGFKALQGISGPQRFQVHKAYGAPERLPSAHTCFNQLDLPEYSSKEQLQERMLLAIHEASEGFGFG
ncbi:E3 ubiquitin-protein ligase UPL1-like [Primulina tabacum]|uniref:E3 ubiquitin-protein ligase UPL1-like n=1 Tax=Primulina tabacum TaxID=48773 RepID=UPI003F5A0664